MKGYIKIRKKSLEVLKTMLPDNLDYHGVHHTLNVLKISNKYIKREKVDPYNAKLLRLGVLLHDIGFSVSKLDHENQSALIAERLMLRYGFNPKDINTVKGLIMATVVPQNPKNYLEKIICDADLDYLGRNDFYEVSDLLYKELKSNDHVSNKTDWNKMQIKFLEAHQYHTAFARQKRQPKKEKRIEELKKMVSKD